MKKDILDHSQMITLIQLGIDPKQASEKIYHEITDSGRYYPQPAFTVMDLVRLLPKYIDRFHLNIEFSGMVCAYYRANDDRGGSLHSELHQELIDCLYNLLVWVIKKGYLKNE